MRSQGGFAKEPFAWKEISRSAIAHWRLLLVASVGLVVVAIAAWTNIPRREDPKLDAAAMQITLTYPGASPEDVEAQVVRVVEPVLLEMNGVDELESTALPNAAHFLVRMSRGTAMDAAVERVRGMVQGIKKDLPAEVIDPTVLRLTTDSVPQLVVGVVGNSSDETLTETAKKLKQEVLLVPGVAGIDLRGAAQRAIQVQLDPVKLARHRLSVDRVVQELRLANARVPLGELRVGPLLTLLQVDGDLRTAGSVMKVPVGSVPDDAGATRTITVADVAEVREQSLALKQRFVVDGQPAVGLEVRFRAEDNAPAVAAEVNARLHAFQSSLPARLRIEVVHDQAAWTEVSIATLLESLGMGILLVMLVITVGMGWRAALVVASVLPLAFGGAIVGLYLAGFSIDQISMAGLIVALGLLVDDAVVVTESIRIMRDKGLSPVRASVYGAARVFWANNGTTAVACASFLPLFFMGGNTGSFIRGIPAAVTISLVVSLLVAQLLTPWIATWLLTPTPQVDGRGKLAMPSPIADHEAFDRNEDSAEGHAETNAVIRGMKAGYGRIMPWIVRHPEIVIAAFLAMLLGSCALLPRIGVQFFPKASKPALFVTVALPRGTDPEITAQKLIETMTLVRKDPAVVQTSAVLGGGYPKIFTGRTPHAEGKDFADILVRTKEGQSEGLAARLRRDLTGIVGASCTVDELYQGPPVSHPIVVSLYGDDLAKLGTYAERTKAYLRGIPGAVNVSDTLSESVPVTRLRLDADRALRLGLTPGQVGSTLRWLYGEDKVTELRGGDDAVQVVLGTASTDGDPFTRLAATPIPTGGGNTVAIREAGSASLGTGFAVLKRYNGRRLVEVSADLAGGELAANVIKKLDVRMKAETWASGYGYGYGGAQKETSASFKGLGIAALFAMLIIFLLLVSMFGSLRLAVIVLAAVPFAMIGAFPGLALTNNPFGFMAFLGVIALLGVYVNHKIYFVDRMTHLLERGDDLATAMRKAGQDRLRPVVLTALTAILGLLPLTLTGGPLWASFGWVNVFGLVASIPLSLLLLPAIITVVYARKGRARVVHDDADADVVEETTRMVVDRSPGRSASEVIRLLQNT